MLKISMGPKKKRLPVEGGKTLPLCPYTAPAFVSIVTEVLHSLFYVCLAVSPFYFTSFNLFIYFFSHSMPVSLFHPPVSVGVSIRGNKA